MSRDNSEFEGATDVPGVKAAKQPAAPEQAGGMGQVPPPQPAPEQPAEQQETVSVG